VSSAIEEDEPGQVVPHRATRLLGAQPNPFRLATSIGFLLGQPQNVKISVYDPIGRRVNVLAEQHLEAGEHSVAWRGRDSAGRDVAPAVYLIRLEGEDGRGERKVVLLK
jgi:flagellar hook assembly protein FlgD